MNNKQALITSLAQNLHIPGVSDMLSNVLGAGNPPPSVQGNPQGMAPMPEGQPPVAPPQPPTDPKQLPVNWNLIDRNAGVPNTPAGHIQNVKYQKRAGMNLPPVQLSQPIINQLKAPTFGAQ